MHFVNTADWPGSWHVEVQTLLLSRKGKVFRKGIGLVEHTVPEAESG